MEHSEMNPRISWSGSQGLKHAENEILAFYSKYGKSPTKKDMGGIASAAQRGYWREFSIADWNDLLAHCGLKSHIDHKKWDGKQGLEKAKEKIFSFIQNEGKTPRKKDMPNIASIAQRGKWSEFGIKSWNDLLDYFQIKKNFSFKTKGKSLPTGLCHIIIFKHPNDL